MKNIFLFEILLAITLVTVNLYAVEYQQIGTFTYNFSDGLHNTEFLTAGRPFNYRISFTVVGELPPWTIYHYHMYCSAEEGANWTDNERFEPVEIENMWIKTNNSSAYSGENVTRYFVKGGFLLPTDKEFRYCTIQGKEFYYVDDDCVDYAVRANLPNTTHCKRILPISLYNSDMFQVYSESAYNTQLQLLQQEKQHENDLEQLHVQMQQQREQHEKDLEMQKNNLLIGAGIALIAAFLPFALSEFWRWWNRPRFELTLKNEDPFVQTGVGKWIDYEHGWDMYHGRSNWLSIGIKNTGGRTAKNCYVKLMEMIEKNSGERIKPFFPSPLKWTVFEDKRIDLAKSEFHLLNLVSQNDKDEFVYPACQITNELERRLPDVLGPGTYKLKIMIHADDTESKELVCEISISKNYEDLKFIF